MGTSVAHNRTLNKNKAQQQRTQLSTEHSRLLAALFLRANDHFYNNTA